ncbi:MAG TPA: DUF2442 domain-containing protein [Gemmatimonadales bacterium]|nr:DUF2442 domain-containing protein [Gemmatimonadales bacterium]
MTSPMPAGMPFPRVTGVSVQPPYRLHLTFTDGTSGEVDGRRWLDREPAGVFAPLRDPARFAEVTLDPDAGTIRWPGDVDLCPDVLYALCHGVPLPGIA